MPLDLNVGLSHQLGAGLGEAAPLGSAGTSVRERAASWLDHLKSPDAVTLGTIPPSSLPSFLDSGTLNSQHGLLSPPLKQL